MAFMEAQITDKQSWLTVDTNYGMQSIPDDLFNVDEMKKIVQQEDWQAMLDVVADYLEIGNHADKVFSAEIVKGYGVRLSAPGYMDCTDWTVFKTKADAKAWARELSE